MIKTKTLYFNLFLTLLALGLHGYLANKFFSLQSATSSGESFCNLGGIWNCDAVNTSPYAKFLGQPIALWGFATHLIFLLAQVMMTFRQEVKDFWHDLVIYIASIIAVTSVVMAFISLTRLNSACLFCVAAYVFSFLNLIVLKLAGFEFGSAFKNLAGNLQTKATWMSALAIPVLVFVLGTSWGGSLNSSQMKDLASDKAMAWAHAPAQTFDKSLGLHMGAPIDTAKMTIVEFADFRCPHCKHAAPSIKAFVQSRPDVAFLFKAYPLDGTCNLAPGMNGQGDGISCRLAFAVVCAEKTEKKGWSYYDQIFSDQHVYAGIRDISELDTKLCQDGIQDCEKFKACLNEESTKVEVQKMAQEGTQAGIRGTPTFFVNDRLLENAQVIPVLEKVYETLKAQ